MNLIVARKDLQPGLLVGQQERQKAEIRVGPAAQDLLIQIRHLAEEEEVKNKKKEGERNNYKEKKAETEHEETQKRGQWRRTLWSIPFSSSFSSSSSSSCSSYFSFFLSFIHSFILANLGRVVQQAQKHHGK